jgi:outer membrane protein insertion porin family
VKLTLIALVTASIAVLAIPLGEISVEGNGYVGDSLIIRSSGLRTGNQANPLDIQSGIRDLFALGYFSEVEILADSTGGILNILIRVSENPILADFVFENTDCLDENKARDSIPLFPGQTVNLADIENARQILLDMYADKNRHAAVVETRWDPPDSDGRSQLVFICEEGPDIRVGEIVFEGNTVFDDGRLRGRMKTKQDSFWRSGRFDETDFQEDLDKVENYYHDHGYPDARVLSVEKSMLEDGRHMRIDITIDEGNRFFIGHVFFSGNEAIPDSLLYELSKIEEGEEYRISSIESTLENLYGIFQERGHFYASVSPEVTAGSSDSILDVTFHIVEGDRAHIRRIDIAGNTRTLDNVIRRELTVYPGDLFQRSDFIRSIRNIFYLNFFSDVYPDFAEIDGSPDVDLIFNVVEKTTGRAGVGAGYGAQDGLNGYLEFSEDNIFGRGQRVAVNYQFSKTKQDIHLSFTEPWFRDTPLLLGGELFHTTSNYSQYDKRKTGGSIIVGRPIPWLDYTSASIRYTLQRVDVFNITTDSTSYYFDLWDTDWPQWDSSIRLSLTRDSRDRKVFPGDGAMNTVSAEYSGGFLGGDIGFQKYLIDSNWYVPAFWRFFVTLRARAGLVAGFADLEPPAYELFELGGTGFYGLRGYGSRTIGAVEGFETVGGRTMLILSAEYRLRIIDQIQLALFGDAGNAWSSISSTNLSEMNRGAGIGIRVEVPMLGILGLDYAYGFDGPDSGWRPHFQIGTSF